MSLRDLFRERVPAGMREYDVEHPSLSLYGDRQRVVAADACDAIERANCFAALCSCERMTVRVVATGERVSVKLDGMKVVLA